MQKVKPWPLASSSSSRHIFGLWTITCTGRVFAVVGRNECWVWSGSCEASSQMPQRPSCARREQFSSEWSCWGDKHFSVERKKAHILENKLESWSALLWFVHRHCTHVWKTWKIILDMLYPCHVHGHTIYVDKTLELVALIVLQSLLHSLDFLFSLQPSFKKLYLPFISTNTFLSTCGNPTKSVKKSFIF